MSEKRKNRDQNAQKWVPHWSLEFLYRVWRVAFAAIKIAAGAAATVLLVGIFCAFAFVGSLGEFLQKDILPFSDYELDDAELELTSYVYYVDKNGNIQKLQELYTDMDRDYATYDQIPEDLINAAIAIEDKRFYEHQGVDWITTIKACARMLFGNDSAGGSGITQQLIKNLRLKEDATADDVTVQRKVMEIFRAIYVEKNYSKKTIMEMYLNTIYLGQGYYGVRSAAEFYFGKELEMLTAAECASLISITNNPSIFDPSSDTFEYKGKLMTGKERNRDRQINVLWSMRNEGWLTEEEYQEALNQEMVFKSGIAFEDSMTTCPNEDCGSRKIVSALTYENNKYYCPVCGTYIELDEDASEVVYSYFVDTVLEDLARQMVEADGWSWNDATSTLYMQKIQRGGYHIYSTLDMDAQNQVDKIYKDLSQIPDTRGSQQLQSAIVLIDNRTGDIVAMAGGVGDEKVHDGYNRATDAERQSGSSIKPLTIYAPGFEAGVITPATVIKDLPFTYEGGAWPANDDKIYNYAWTVYQGIVDSVNGIAINTLGGKVGLDYSYDFAKHKFHLNSLRDGYYDSNGEYHTDKAYAPLAMGAQSWGVTVREMASAFATFANDGVYRSGRTFTKVYDSDGNMVWENKQESEKILSKKAIDYTNYCLSNATRSGTGYEADLSPSSRGGITTAGKTGTTASNKDRWYCGYTGYYTAAVWCGFDTPASITVVGGGNPAAQLFRKVMQPLHKGKADVPLYDSSMFETVTVCRDSGKLATQACRYDIRTLTQYKRWETVQVYWDDVPTETCDEHIIVEQCSGGGAATEYCHKFAEAGYSIKFTHPGLVKITQADIDEILLAAPFNLRSYYTDNRYAYLINDDGSDGVFTGFKGELANQHMDAPYLICPVHTQEAWEQYLDSLPPVVEPTEPEPTLPPPTEHEATQPDPTQPTGGI